MGTTEDDPGERWSATIPEQHWQVYHAAIAEARKRGIDFALGGAFALAAYTGEFRGTKDLDIYVVPAQREAMIDAVAAIGLQDMHHRQPYDRRWIYRAESGPSIVDIIWAMANHTAQVDIDWLRRGPEISLHGESLRVLPPEELVWTKLYVMQRDRCDWPDILNVVYSAAPTMDWEHLMKRLGDDWPLLSGILSLYNWLFPCRARKLPQELRGRFGLPDLPDGGSGQSVHRLDKLDSRRWFRHEFPEQPC